MAWVFVEQVQTVLRATTRSATPIIASPDTDRAIQVMQADGTGLTTLFDVPGAFDSAPPLSPNATRIAFERMPTSLARTPSATRRSG